jgi:transcriptional regulator GlxA family with amidase domain
MKTIAVLLFPGVTVLDAIGPYQALAQLPDHGVRFVGERAGPVGDSHGLQLVADCSIHDIDAADVLLVPGGLAAITMSRTGHELIDWIGAVHRTTSITSSVCTGALMLGKAGILHGLPATTHWYCHAELADHGATPTDERVVDTGHVITAAGVSAGIDMALHIVERVAGERFASGVQLDMEYDPQPPRASGHPRCADPAITAWVRGLYDDALNDDAPAET